METEGRKKLKFGEKRVKIFPKLLMIACPITSLFFKLPWPEDSEGTSGQDFPVFVSSLHLPSCIASTTQGHTRWRFHIILFIAKRQVGKL